MEQKKITKKTYFETLKGIVEAAQITGDISAKDMLAFIDKQIEQIDNKAAAAKAKNAEKKAEGDALRETVAELLTNEYQTVDKIVEQVIVETENEAITKQMIVSRLTQLVKLGRAAKEQVKDEETKRRVMAYKAV